MPFYDVALTSNDAFREDAVLRRDSLAVGGAPANTLAPASASIVVHLVEHALKSSGVGKVTGDGANLGRSLMRVHVVDLGPGRWSPGKSVPHLRNITLDTETIKAGREVVAS